MAWRSRHVMPDAGYCGDMSMVDEPLAGGVPAQGALKRVPVLGEMGQLKLPRGALRYMNLRDTLDLVAAASVAAIACGWSDRD